MLPAVLQFLYDYHCTCYLIITYCYYRYYGYIGVYQLFSFFLCSYFCTYLPCIIRWYYFVVPLPAICILFVFYYYIDFSFCRYYNYLFIRVIVLLFLVLLLITTDDIITAVARAVITLLRYHTCCCSTLLFYQPFIVPICSFIVALLLPTLLVLLNE